jgi:hypothetical protein
MPQPTLEITPLGAALVEAMPDRKKMAHVRKLFKQKKCPDSELFSVEEVEHWYFDRGQKIKGIERRGSING